jgi:hypothetical protein
MNEYSVNYLESASFSDAHLETLLILKLLAKNGRIAESKPSSVAGRFAYWHFILLIPLDSPPINIINSNGKLIRKIDLPTSISKYVSEFCSGDLYSAIFLLDQITRDLTDGIGMTNNMDFENKRYQQRRNLQENGFFLRDIEEIIRYGKKRSYDDAGASQSKTVQEMLNIDLAEGEHVCLLTPKIQKTPNTLSSKFEYNGKCLICHKFKESKGTYCNQHTRKNKKEIDSPIRKHQNLFIRAYENLELKGIIDKNIELEYPGEKFTRKEKKSLLKKNGYGRNDYLYQQFQCLLKWSKLSQEHKQFNRELRIVESNYIDGDVYEPWETCSIAMFREVISLTKKHMHTRNIFLSLLQVNTSIENLKKYLFEVFYHQADFQRTHPNFQRLCPVDFIDMLSHWSQIALIEAAANKPSLKELLKASKKSIP